ncbi:hypothetical protein JRO89_XS13G0122400 [Xanthoceras sorbifolium]|uniref:Uncharacterized protein n=1 Tax=Xanthoceras sorbifolium TaxID=99658 RepID=A0ABQ8H7Y6_9ROSI|nr:hypothetical protein JRO89_XS13G0122400 [Xanthoceras sorbifolium]
MRRDSVHVDVPPPNPILHANRNESTVHGDNDLHVPPFSVADSGSRGVVIPSDGLTVDGTQGLRSFVERARRTRFSTPNTRTVKIGSINDLAVEGSISKLPVTDLGQSTKILLVRKSSSRSTDMVGVDTGNLQIQISSRSGVQAAGTEATVISYFVNLFKSSSLLTTALGTIVDSLAHRLLPAAYRHLDRLVTSEEVQIALFQMAPSKPPSLPVKCYIIIMMKVTLLVLFVGFLLISASLQAEAKRLISEEKQKLMMDRRSRLLISKRHNMESETITSNNDDAKDDDVDSEPNESYGKYGNNNGSDSESHHYYPNDKKPKD